MMTSDATERKFRIFGFTDEVTTCDCCGKANLSGTFAVEMQDGELLHYGSVCVTRNTKIKNPKSAAEQYLQERMKAARIKLRQSPEWHRKEARFALRTAMKVPVGRESAMFVKAEMEAFSVVRRALEIEYRIERGTLFD
jgi:hypothetical protein